MNSNYFIIGGIYHDRKGAYEVLEVKLNNFKARYLHNDEITIKLDFNIARRIDENIQKEEATIWLVCHQKNLWNIDHRLIGFHRESQWAALKENNIVIYYRIGEDKIKGVFKIVEKRKNINPAFDDVDIEKKPVYQCRLELLSNDIKCNCPSMETDFSFFAKWSSMRHGGLKWQIFPATRNDLELVTTLSIDKIIEK